jgi:hypothetical protein
MACASSILLLEVGVRNSNTVSYTNFFNAGVHITADQCHSIFRHCNSLKNTKRNTHVITQLHSILTVNKVSN